MKMTSLPSPDLYPLDVYAPPRASKDQMSTRNNQMCCFETEMVSGKFAENEVGTSVATGHSDEACCIYSGRYLMGFEDSALRHYAFNVINSDIPRTVEKNFAKFADSIRSEIDTIPQIDSPTTIDGDMKSFETSAKKALDDFMGGLLDLIQEKTELINQAFDELITAISGNFNGGNKNSVAEIHDTENTGDGADLVTSDPLPFNFDEFETKLREKFVAALDELLAGLKETILLQENYVVEGNGAAYVSLSGAYDQMMASTNSTNLGSERESFEILA